MFVVYLYGKRIIVLCCKQYGDQIDEGKLDFPRIKPRITILADTYETLYDPVSKTLLKIQMNL